MSTGQAVRKSRQMRGITQEDAARLSGLTLKSYGQIERGHIRDPHLSTLWRIANALEVPASNLLGEPALAEVWRPVAA